MTTKSLEEIYTQMCSRRDAISQQYLSNRLLKTADPVCYQRYRDEFRAINKRLRIIRQCIPVNPVLSPEKDTNEPN